MHACVDADTMQWSAVDVYGSAPESRLDFATCTLRNQRRSTDVSTDPVSVSQPLDTAPISHTAVDEHRGKKTTFT